MSQPQYDWPVELERRVAWQDCYPVVERAARALLDPLPVSIVLSTAELASRLWPPPIADEDRAAHKRLFKALGAAADHGMVAYATVVPGTARWAQSGEIKRIRWHAPTAARPALPQTSASPTGTSLAAQVAALQERLDALGWRLSAVEDWGYLLETAGILLPRPADSNPLDDPVGLDDTSGGPPPGP